ncbi:MAG: hypothetical protein VX899_18220 [Myxococcota bacterium]|nr:hypothetical protein [Myxococcota bacterium]
MARYLHPDREISVEDDKGRIGCASFGLLFYASLIAGLGLVALLCAGLTLNSALMATTSPKQLTSGVETESWRLSELRRWEILAPGDTPQLYHDHSEWADGSSGCIVVDGALTRWDDELSAGTVVLAGAEVGYDGPQDAPESVWVRDDVQRLDCPFGPEEGSDRFFRMLQAESAATPGSP